MVLHTPADQRLAAHVVWFGQIGNKKHMQNIAPQFLLKTSRRNADSLQFDWAVVLQSVFVML